MKKLLLIIALLFVISCDRNKGEQMLYDYQQEKVSALNFRLNDLGYKVEKIEEIGIITASDSMNFLRRELAKYWRDNPETRFLDASSFQKVKEYLNNQIDRCKDLADRYREDYLFAIEVNHYPYKLKSKERRDSMMYEIYAFEKELSKVEKTKQYYDILSKRPDYILSVKYRAIYSVKNPMLGGQRQTFDKIFYTNPAQTAFIKEGKFTENK